MPKTNTTVRFNRDAIARILQSQVNGSEFTYEELVDEQKFAGFELTVPVGSSEGIEVTTVTQVSKTELDNLILEVAKVAAKVAGVSSSTIKYTFADSNSGLTRGCVVESVEVILNSITR